jgi:molybdopterin synthase catalytic subunit
MSESIHVSVSTETINIQDAYDFVTDPAHGAVDVFIGAVRNHHEGQGVQGMTYDVHEELAEKTFQEICLETQNLWEGIKIYMSHYKGQLNIGGISVIIAVSSAHRAESFEACRYIIEELKKRAPVWKQEHYEHGPSEWLPGHSLQSQATQIEERLLEQDQTTAKKRTGGGCGQGSCGCA